MEMCFKDVVAIGGHAWAPSSEILLDSILGSSWFQDEKEFEFETPTNNEEAIIDDYLTNNTDEGLDQINLEESEVSERSDINKNGNKIKKRKASSNTIEKEKNKVSTGLRISSSMEKIAEVVALCAAINVGPKDTSLSIESVMDVVRNLPVPPGGRGEEVMDIPVQQKKLSLDIKGNKTDIVICAYDDHFLVIATQIGSMGTILHARKEEGVSIHPTFSVSILLGKRDEPMLAACARQIIEHISNAGSSRSLVLSLGLRDHSLPTLKGIVSAVTENRLW
ncbi:hypothetical protein HAX54_016402 [Datura stramonium]|uniref:Proteasome assembly chaperone 3 n=1 Tax=Datura stramonium TaxID=4076 RepID=A0ABS8UL19_DATST|nr:hypothetical protein [Datura stramonium]